MQHSNSSRTHRATIQRLVSPPVRHITAPPPSLYSSSHSPHPTSNLSSPSTSDPVTVMGLYAAFADAIDAYTGLSPAAFFTIGAIMVGTYRLVSGMFVAPDNATERALAPAAEPPAPPAKPVQLGEVTLEELRAYDGSDPKKPLLIAIKGQIYDVSMSRMFYGPGGPYALFAGHDASRALALMSFDRNDLTSNLDGLRQADLEVLQDWEYKFMEKYVKVGQVVSEKTTNGEETVSNEKAEEGSELKNGEETVCNEKAEGGSELHQKEAQSDVINKGTEVGAEMI